MSMINWVENHALISYLIFAAFVGSMPPVPDSASYGLRWFYGFVHMAAMNLRTGFQLMNGKKENGQ